MLYGRDTIQRLTVTGGTTDEVGVYHPGTEIAGTDIICDVEPAGQATATQYDDGVNYPYSWTVTLDVDVETFAPGDRIVINRPGEPEQRATVVGFHRYAFLSKLWAN